MGMTPRVRVTTGTVAGTWSRGVAVFRSIPFAAAPVGVNRLTRPRPPRRWDGIRDSSEFGSAPPQPGRRSTGDDWLNLAVWTADPGMVGLPVVVWISGGAYLRCTTANPHQDGAQLAVGGAVVVSINYRTGAEGFARLDGFPNNRGLLDQIAALRWVQDNVTAFGGDPDNVTVFGQSAGAGSIAALLVMPEAAGLFHRAVLHSLPGTYFSSTLAADITAHLAHHMPGKDCRSTHLAAAEPEELVAAASAVTAHLPHMSQRWGPVAHTPTPFSPIVDEKILPSAPWSALAAGHASAIPLLVGHVRDEFRLLATRLAATTDEEVDQLIDSLGATIDSGQYRAAFPGASVERLREIALADWLLRMPTIHLAEAAHAGGNPVWVSELYWGFGPQGASHGLDTLLVFGTADIHGEITSAGPVALAESRRLSEITRAELLTFAADGDPGWPPYQPPRLLTRVHDSTPSVQPYPESASRTIWRNHRFNTIGLP